MPSKLHRHGLPPGATALWSPLLKTGVLPVQGARDSLPPGALSRGAEARLGDLEHQLAGPIQAAHQRGREEGEAAGRQQAAAQLQPALERLARTIADLAAVRPRLRHDAEEDVVKLAIAVARRILYREIHTDPAALLGLVRAACDKLDLRAVYRVRSSPQDAGLLQQHFQQIGAPYKIEVQPDPALQRGSVIFETDRGGLDASVETQLNEIERGFADLVRRSQ